MSGLRAVDLFGGWGGFTLGAEMAGVDVVWAANHWPLAVEAHALNHPRTAHVCQDLRQADWTALPAFDLLLASPACQPHSTASQPSRSSDEARAKHDAERATAWSVVDCADANNPRAIIVENVPGFAKWRLFGQWVGCLEALGYHVQSRVLCASHHGVPQRRNRLVVVATRKPITLTLPEPTPEPAFGPCIEWDRGDWRPITSAMPGARLRIAVAQANHGPVCLTQHVTGHPGVPLHEPIRTITTKDQWAIVNGDVYRPLTERENARAQGFPDSYGWPAHATRGEIIRGIGNAAPPPLTRDIINAVQEAI